MQGRLILLYILPFRYFCHSSHSLFLVISFLSFILFLFPPYLSHLLYVSYQMNAMQPNEKIHTQTHTIPSIHLAGHRRGLLIIKNCLSISFDLFGFSHHLCHLRLLCECSKMHAFHHNCNFVIVNHIWWYMKIEQRFPSILYQRKNKINIKPK